MIAHLARISILPRTRNGRPEVVLPSGAVVRVTVRQLASMLREARYIREVEGEWDQDCATPA